MSDGVIVTAAARASSATAEAVGWAARVAAAAGLVWAILATAANLAGREDSARAAALTVAAVTDDTEMVAWVAEA